MQTRGWGGYGIISLPFFSLGQCEERSGTNPPVDNECDCDCLHFYGKWRKDVSVGTLTRMMEPPQTSRERPASAERSADL